MPANSSLARKAARRQQDGLAQAALRGDHLADDGDDQRDGHRQPHAGQDVGQRVGQADLPDEGGARQLQAARHLATAAARPRRSHARSPAAPATWRRRRPRTAPCRGSRPKIEIASGISGRGRQRADELERRLQPGAHRRRDADQPRRAAMPTGRGQQPAFDHALHGLPSVSRAGRLAQALGAGLPAVASGVGRNTRLTQLGVAGQPTTARPAPRARRAEPTQSAERGAFMAAAAHAPRHAPLQPQHARVDRIADDADPAQPGQHQRRVEALLRDHHRVAHAVRVGGDLDRHGDHQRDRHAQAQRHEQPRHDRRQHDLARPGRAATGPARG